MSGHLMVGHTMERVNKRLGSSTTMPKGRVPKKNLGKSMVFYQTPLGPPAPPPGLVFFPRKKLTPIFFLKNASLMAETNFTLGPISKTIKFPF